jgi:ribosome maturation factor RimP
LGSTGNTRSKGTGNGPRNASRGPAKGSSRAGAGVPGRDAAPGRPPRPGRPVREAPLVTGTGNVQKAVETTVSGLGYELVDIERAARGLLRITIDRVPGRSYSHGGVPDAGSFITVDDCELVTRQLQYALEVEGVDYARLEVSSPGLDRPLRQEADYQRFAGEAVQLVLKAPFQGRKNWRGRLLAPAAADAPWQLVFEEGKTEQVLGFALDEVREARLVPVVDFKGRRAAVPAPVPAEAPAGEPASGPHSGQAGEEQT